VRGILEASAGEKRRLWGIMQYFDESNFNLEERKFRIDENSVKSFSLYV